jgi:hypothetical protein
MCKDCFEKEYYKFNYSEEFDVFLEEFNSKIAKTVQFVSTEKYKTNFHGIYKCTSCHEVWWLSEPDNHWRGYFIKNKNARKLVDTDDSKWNLLEFRYLIFVVIVVLILIQVFVL